MTVSPKTQALRYRIWAYANPRGWDVIAGIYTAADIVAGRISNEAGV